MKNNPMKWIKKMIIFFLVSGFLLMQGQAAEEITLQQAVDAGIKQDYQVKNRELDIQIATLNREKTRMKKRFLVSAEGSYLFKSGQMELDLPIGQFLPMSPIQSIHSTIGTRHIFDVKVAATQPFFTGGMLDNAEKAEAVNENLEKERKSLREIEIAGMIKSSYFTYRLLESKKHSLLILLKNLELHQERLTRFYEENLVRKSDLLETKIKISEAKISLEELERTLAEERLRFARLCPFKLEAIEKNYDEEIEDFTGSLAFFTANHPLLQTINRGKQVLDLKKKITAGKYLPQVAGFAELHYGKPGIDFFKNDWSLYFQGGIGVKLAIFDWHELKKEKRIADLSIEKLDNQKEELVADVKKNLAQLYARKQSIEKQLSTTRELVQLAAQDVELKENLYQESQVDNTDFLSALLTKERYQSMQSELELQVRLVKLNINSLIGRIDKRSE